jgi:hypothetical protein
MSGIVKSLVLEAVNLTSSLGLEIANAQTSEDCYLILGEIKELSKKVKFMQNVAYRIETIERDAKAAKRKDE